LVLRSSYIAQAYHLLSFAASGLLRVALTAVKALHKVATERGRKFFLWYLSFLYKKESTSTGRGKITLPVLIRH
jgi:hypothetical protein